MKYYEEYFAHPELQLMDNLVFNGLSYIGVAVENKPPSITEYFIEFAYNYDSPSLPMINKVFTSISKIPLNDIATDDELGLTYIFDSRRNDLIVLNRAMPNSLFTYNFKINFLNYYNFKHEKGIDLFLFSSNDDFYPHLVMKNGEDYIVFGKFNFPKNILRCRFNKQGNYTFQFNSPADCSINQNGVFDYKVCWNNSTLNLLVDNRTLFTGNIDVSGLNKSKIIIIIVIVIVVVATVITIGTVIYCKRKKRLNVQIIRGKLDVNQINIGEKKVEIINTSANPMDVNIEFSKQSSKQGENMNNTGIDNKL
jgi:hypothetical protein